MLKIEKYLQENGESKTNTIAEHLGLSLARTRKILSQMDSLEAIGTNTNRRYRLKNNSNYITALGYDPEKPETELFLKKPPS